MNRRERKEIKDNIKNYHNNIIVGIVMLVISLIVVFYALFKITNINKQKYFKKTEGVIINSNVSKHIIESDSGSSFEEYINIDYKYIVNNSEYISHNSFSINKNKLVYNTGSSIIVYYNPNNPKESVLKIETNILFQYMVLVFGILFIIISISSIINNFFLEVKSKDIIKSKGKGTSPNYE